MQLEKISINPEIFNEIFDITTFDGIHVWPDKKCKCKVTLKWGSLKYSNGAEDWIVFCPECNKAYELTNDEDDFITHRFSNRYKKHWFMIQWPIRMSLDATQDLDILDLINEIYDSTELKCVVEKEDDKMILYFEDISRCVKCFKDMQHFINRITYLSMMYGIRTTLIDEKIRSVDVNYGSALHPEIHFERHHSVIFTLEKLD